jgi:hypothetical protein
MGLGSVAARSALIHVLAAAVLQVQTGASRLMLAAVTDPRGHAMVDVGADDFVVQEGAASREVLSVRLADYPIVVLLDTSASAEDFALVQRAATHFVERLGNDRPVSAGAFGAAPQPLTSFEDERQRVLDRINALEPGSPPVSDGATGGASNASRLLAAAAHAADTLHRTGSLFSSIVILSANAEGNDAATAATVAPIVDSGAIVHVIALQPPATNAAVSEAVKTIVNQTRGELTPIYAAASFQAALDRLVDRLATEMLIEYLVPTGSRPIDAKVGIRVPGARVRGLGVAPK